MFKKVEYLGFEGQPDLKVRAEQLTPVLADEVRRWRDGVEVVWSPVPGRSDGLNVTLSLTLPCGATGSALTTFRPKDLTDQGWAAIRCGRAWSNLLGDLGRCLDERIREWSGAETLAEPAEA